MAEPEKKPATRRRRRPAATPPAEPQIQQIPSALPPQTPPAKPGLFQWKRKPRLARDDDIPMVNRIGNILVPLMTVGILVLAGILIARPATANNLVWLHMEIGIVAAMILLLWFKKG